MMNNEKKYKEYSFKIVRSGDVTEIYAYNETLLKTNKKNVEDMCDDIDEAIEKKERKIKKIDNEDYYRRKSDIADTRKKLKRLIYANIGQYEQTDKFITLTFKGEPPTREKVVKEFREFKRRFKYKYGEKFEYLGVIEKGEQGTKRLHIHVVVFGVPFIKHNDLLELWKNGRIEIKKVYHMGDVSDYLTKYIDKTLYDGYIPKGKRFYFPSTNLLKPQEFFLEDNEMFDFMNTIEIGNPIYNFSFDSNYVGLCNYTKYKKQSKV